jgi:hypothetical protein
MIHGASNIALERTAGSPTLAASAQRERSAALVGTRSSPPGEARSKVVMQH